LAKPCVGFFVLSVSLKILLNKKNMSALQIGEKMPNFQLLNQHNELINSQTSAWQNRPMVVFFYPKDNTPGCTAEVCEFRDEFESFRNLDAVVIGISADSVSSHQDFAKKHRLPFDLLSDTDKIVRNLFGVKANLFGLLSGRATYIFDKDKILKHFFQSQLFATSHIKEALEGLKK
jgi:thioredoxin-dependent peroxiredoxin